VVTEKNFKNKVIIDKKQHGSYFFVNEFQVARKEFTRLSVCRLCNPQA